MELTSQLHMPASLSSGKETGTHLMGPTTGVDGFEEEKKFLLLPEFALRTVQPAV